MRGSRRETRPRARPAVVLALSVAAAGCAATLEPTDVPFPDAAARPVSHIESIASYGRASSTIADIFQKELGFPPFTATLHFYSHRGAFEAALLDSGYDAALARTTASVMAAVGGHRGVLINEAALAPMPWPARVGLLAHELTHTLQYELTGGTRGTSDQWLREGFAEWVAMRVMNRLRAMPIDSYRREKLDKLRASNHARAPRLNEMATFPRMVALAARNDIAPYAQAFLAVDALIERHGPAGILRYFEAFRRSPDRLANFAAVFGEDLDTFDAAMRERLWPAKRR